MSIPDRRAWLDRAHSTLSIRRQCRLLGLARSGVYRTPAPKKAVPVGPTDGVHITAPTRPSHQC
jgi:hypothetical protein